MIETVSLPLGTTFAKGNAKFEAGTPAIAEAIAFGAGGFAGAMLCDLIRAATGSVVTGYTTVFAIEAVLFIVAAVLAARIGMTATAAARQGAHCDTADAGNGFKAGLDGGFAPGLNGR
jgi:uncharacterized membrane protein